MDENTIKIIKERFDMLPQSIQEMMTSSHYEEALIDISKQYHLNIEQMGILEKETLLVMMGLTPVGNFEEQLMRELNIDKSKGDSIAQDINEKIFIKIRDLLKLMNTPQGEEPVVDEELEGGIGMSNEIKTTLIPLQTEISLNQMQKKEKEVLSKAGIEIIEESTAKSPQNIPEKKENTETETLPIPEKLEIETAPELSPNTDDVGVANIPIPPKKEEVHPILAQKISESSQTPIVKTEYSLNNLSKTNTPSTANPKPKIPPVDPYREVPE